MNQPPASTPTRRKENPMTITTARHRRPGRPSYPAPVEKAADLVDVDQLRRGAVVVPTAFGLILGGAGAASAWDDQWSSAIAVTSGVWSAPEVTLTATSDQLARASWPALGGPDIAYSVEQRVNAGPWTALPSGVGVLSATATAPGGSTVEVRATGSISGQPGPAGQASVVLPMATPAPVLSFSSPTVARVAWPAVSGATRYRMEYALDGGAWQLGRYDENGWVEWAVHAGQNVAVRVQADNGSVYSPWSNTITARSPYTNLNTPIGSLDAKTRTGSTINLSGWAMDMDGTVPVSLHVYVVPGTDSANIIQRGVATVTVANLSRPDVAAAYPGMGAAHGYNVTVAAPAVPSTACIFVIDHTSSTLGSNNPLLACVTL